MAKILNIIHNYDPKNFFAFVPFLIKKEPVPIFLEGLRFCLESSLPLPKLIPLTPFSWEEKGDKTRKFVQITSYRSS